MKKEALWYKKLSRGEVQCYTCQRQCIIPEGKRGWCLTRENEGSILYSLIYGAVSSISINPIEKKPIFHFYPGSRWLSLGSWGCNFRCPGCQNWEIAHWKGTAIKAGYSFSPEELVRMALENNCLGISWTFNEPTLWLEYTLDASRIAKEKGLYLNYVTNGALTEEALDALAPYLDVFRVDIKGFSSGTYQTLARFSEFEGILKVVEKVKHYGIHVEIVTNIIPGINDDEEQLRGIASWIKESLGRETPWHVTKFYPNIRLPDLPPTPVADLEQARDIGLQCGLQYVYLGNVPGHKGENTYCPRCQKLLIRRVVFDIVENNLKEGACPACGLKIPGRL